MKLRYLNIPIRCGDKTCAEGPRKFCPYFLSYINGKGECRLFRMFLKDTKGDGTGWILRCGECLEYEQKTT